MAKNREEMEVTEPVVPKITVKANPEKTFSFEQWAQLRNKADRHLGGLRAFLGTNPKARHSLARWDDIFSAY